MDASQARANPDLADCAREPIHMPGAIQPHGRLLALHAQGLTVGALSRNLAGDFNVEPAALIGCGLAEILDERSAERARALVADGNWCGQADMRLAQGAGSLLWTGLVRPSGDWMLLELEPATSAGSLDAMFDLVEVAIERLRAAQAMKDAGAALVAAVRTLTGFDRVKLYRFDQDWNGEVVAEAKAAEMQSYLGHAFPAADIPAQARALYATSRARLIPDAGYEPVPLIADGGHGAARSIDLSGCMLRSVSPIHCEYLRNMGVVASMSVSILKDGKLWGLIACHHRTPRFVPHRVRQACAMLAHAMEWHLEAATRAAAWLATRAIGQLGLPVTPERDAAEPMAAALERAAPALMALVDAQGFAWIDQRHVVRCGLLPAEAELRALADRLQHGTPAKSAYTDQLGAWCAPLRIAAATASGMAAHRIGDSWAMWFRPEWLHTLTWAGDPTKRGGDLATGRITPRLSFAAWVEIVRARSRPWSADEMAALDLLRPLLKEMSRRESEQLLLEAERRLAQARRLEAVGTLAGGTAHELNNLLQPIMLLGGELKARLAEGDDREHMALILGAAGRARDLIRHLGKSARTGVVDGAPVDLAPLIERALAEVRQALPNGVRIERRFESVLPVSGDAGLLGTTIHNVLRNAADAIGENGIIVVELAPEPAHEPGVPGSWVRLAIGDNGAGMNAATVSRAFEPFFTTKPPGQGTGLGLAVAQSVVTRHGGAISLESAPEVGTTVTIRLPHRGHAGTAP